MTAAKFQAIVKNYYKDNGRDLPWRHTTNPYRIVVSEIMLQQTQVSRVLIKYPEWLTKFPSWKSLASASTAEAIKSWQGLGYNRRALALKKIAEKVVSEYKGKLPKDPEILETFPGIGPATALPTRGACSR
jgi:A/G-specific adenine glycosylase